MTTIANGARLAILDRGVSGLLVAGGGSCQVRLLRAGVELSGNGYSRQRLTEFASSTLIGGSFPSRDSVAINVTASGGSLVFDQVAVYNASGSTLLLRSEYLGDQTVASGSTVAVTIRLTTSEPTPYFWDITVDQQLTEISGRRPTVAIDAPQAYPWLLPDGSVFMQPLFDRLSRYRGQVDFDHEPNTTTPYSAGTITGTNGVISLSGGTFPTDAQWGTNAVYYRRLYVGSTIYNVATRNNPTTLTLTDLSVNIPAGTSYKYAPWDFREIDPKFAASTQEWRTAHDEFAVPLESVLDTFLENGGGLGIYEFAVHIWRRADDILDDVTPGSRAIWKSQCEETLDYVTTSGRRIRDYVDLTGGKFYLTAYNARVQNGNVGAQNRFIERTSIIQETMQELGVPYVIMFLRHTLDLGFGQFLANTTAEEVDRDFIARQVQAAHANDPGTVGFWGARNTAGVREYDLDEDDDYREFIEETIAALPY
jgi:hypothetical protein